jgi:hypothetical protein
MVNILITDEALLSWEADEIEKDILLGVENFPEGFLPADYVLPGFLISVNEDKEIELSVDGSVIEARHHHLSQHLWKELVEIYLNNSSSPIPKSWEKLMEWRGHGNLSYRIPDFSGEVTDDFRLCRTTSVGRAGYVQEGWFESAFFRTHTLVKLYKGCVVTSPTPLQCEEWDEER